MLQATTIPTTTAGADARIERAILSSQLQQLESSRRALQTQLQSTTAPADRAGLATQLADVTQRIAVLDNMIARTQGRVEGAEATTTVPSRPQVIVQGGPPENETMIAFGFFGMVLLLPMAIAMTRRIWRRSGPETGAAISPAIDERLARIEQAVEATALEVERIGEGQRFVTKILTEAEPSIKLPAAELTGKV